MPIAMALGTDRARPLCRRGYGLRASRRQCRALTASHFFGEQDLQHFSGVPALRFRGRQYLGGGPSHVYGRSVRRSNASSSVGRGGRTGPLMSKTLPSPRSPPASCASRPSDVRCLAMPPHRVPAQTLPSSAAPARPRASGNLIHHDAPLSHCLTYLVADAKLSGWLRREEIDTGQLELAWSAPEWAMEKLRRLAWFNHQAFEARVRSRRSAAA
jgi:hypothetical protein